MKYMKAFKIVKEIKNIKKYIDKEVRRKNRKDSNESILWEYLWNEYLIKKKLENSVGVIQLEQWRKNYKRETKQKKTGQ